MQAPRRASYWRAKAVTASISAGVSKEVSSTVDIGHHKINAAQDGDQIRYHRASAHQRDHLKMRKRRCADACPVGHRAAVADQIVAVETLGGLDADARFARRDDWPPAHIEEMCDEGFDVVHRMVFEGRRGQRMPRLVGTLRHVLEALPHNAQALAHLLDAHGSAVVAVAVLAGWNVEFELFVTRIGPLLPIIPLEATGPKPGAGHTPIDRFFDVVGADALGTSLEDAVLHHERIVLVEPRRHVIEEFPNQTVPALRQILRNPADAEPARMHPESADRLDDFEGALTIGEHIEHRRHGADILS